MSASLLAAGSMVLAGCATTDAPKKPLSETIVTDGLVQVRLITNSVGVSALVPKFLVVGLKRSGESSNQYAGLALVPEESRSTQTFAGFVPAGTYSLLSLYGRNGPFAAHFDAANFFSPFEVKAGTLVDLGTLVYQPVGKGDVTLIPVARPSIDRASIARRYPEIASQLTAQPAADPGWKATLPIVRSHASASSDQGLIASALLSATDSASAPKAQQRWADAKNDADLLAYAKASTITLNGPWHEPDGTSWFGTALGQVLKRSPGGSWSVSDTGSLGDVLLVGKSGDTMFTVIEDSTLLLSTDGGTNWVRSPVAIPDGLPISADTGPRGELYVTLRNADTLTIHRLDSLREGAAVALKSVPLSTNNAWTLQPSALSGMVAASQGKFFVARDADNLDVYDMASSTWSAQKTQDSFQMISTSNDGRQLILVDLFGITRNHYVTNNGGRDWRLMKAPHYTMALHMSDALRGFALEMESGAFSSTTSISTTADGGKTWQSGPEMKDRCVRLIVIDATRDLVCTTISGAIISSRDGRQWRVERSVN